MGFLDSILQAPVKLVEVAAETAVRLPAVPLDLAEAVFDGADRGFDKLERPRR